LLGLLLAALAGFLLFPDNRPLLDPDEGRQAEVPREMLAHQDLLVPRVLGAPYYEKPPLQYWLTAGVYGVAGVHAWTARLVPAVAAWLTVLLAFAWGRRAVGPRPAFLGALVLCLSMGFISLGRTVVLDSLLTLWVTASWYTGFLAVARPPLRWRWWLPAAAACGLAVLTKGPVGLVLVVPPVWAFQCLTQPAARPRLGPWAAFIGLAVAVAAPWYALMALRDHDYLVQFFWRANLVRFVRPFDHTQPWWFYFPVLFLATFPWSLLWPALGYFLASRQPRLMVLRTAALGFGSLTVVWCVLFFSASGCKSPPYLAPALPPLSLLLGACVEAVLFRPGASRHPFWRFARRTLPRRTTLAVLAVSVGCYLATAVLGWQKWGWVLGQVGLTAALAAAWCRYGRYATARLTWAACAAATLLMVVLASRDLKNCYAARHSPAAIARLIRHGAGEPAYPIISYGKQWPSALFYLRREVVRWFDANDPEVLVNFLQKRPEVLVLVERGPFLDSLLGLLPETLEPRVYLPKREGQIALVVVRRRDPAARAGGDL
jgi:4-amino-4-deoxy-L-arabinose transferase-like glycosyltransferase